MVHGFAFTLVPVNLWCDGASMLDQARCPCLPRDKGSDIALGMFPHLAEVIVLWLVLVWQGGSCPVILLPERRHHGVVTKGIGVSHLFYLHFIHKPGCFMTSLLTFSPR